MSSQLQVGTRVQWSPDGQHLQNVPRRVPTEEETREGVTVDEMPKYGNGPFTVKAVTTLGNGAPGVVLEELDRPGFAAALLELVSAEATATEVIAAE